MPVSVRSVFAFGLLAAVQLLAGPAIVYASEDRFTPLIDITPDDPGIDDLLMLRLSIDVPSNLLVNFPRLGDRLGGFAVTGQRALEADAEDGGDRKWVQQYRLEPETTGELSIPPLTITVQDPATLEAIDVRTDEVLVHIASIVPADTDLRHIRDILPPVGLPAVTGAFPPWLFLAAVAVVVALLGLGWRRWRVVPGGVEDGSKSPQIAALEALDELRSQSMDAIATERFHISLADLLRRYLNDGFALTAPLKTTEELLQETAKTNSPVREQHGLIASPLKQCDRVKFGRHRPSVDAMQRALDEVTAFVRQTSGLEPTQREAADAD